MYAGDEITAQVKLFEVGQHLDALRASQHIALNQARTLRAPPSISSHMEQAQCAS